MLNKLLYLLPAIFFAIDGNAHALSDKEYKEMYERSTEFRESEKRLNKAWKETYGKEANKANKQFLLDYQRKWLKSDRDEQARELIDYGFSKDCAYARVNNRGKLLSVPQTGELAFIGFGSSIVIPNSNPAVQAKQKVQSQKIAAMRARNALCGIILGTDIQASSSLDAQTEMLGKQFEQAQKDDPLNQNANSNEITRLDEQRNSFLNTQMSKDQIASLSQGVLPPGVTVKTFFNPENTIVEAVAVYLPSISAEAAKMGKNMQNSKLAHPQSGLGGNNPNRSTMPSRGASGQVTNDADL